MAKCADDKHDLKIHTNTDNDVFMECGKCHFRVDEERIESMVRYLHLRYNDNFWQMMVAID